MTTKMERGFNPCFNGFTSLTTTNFIDDYYDNKVSILVLMDSLL